MATPTTDQNISLGEFQRRHNVNKGTVSRRAKQNGISTSTGLTPEDYARMKELLGVSNAPVAPATPSQSDSAALAREQKLDTLMFPQARRMRPAAGDLDLYGVNDIKNIDGYSQVDLGDLSEADLANRHLRQETTTNNQVLAQLQAHSLAQVLEAGDMAGEMAGEAYNAAFQRRFTQTVSQGAAANTATLGKHIQSHGEDGSPQSSSAA